MPEYEFIRVENGWCAILATQKNQLFFCDVSVIADAKVGEKVKVPDWAIQGEWKKSW